MNTSVALGRVWKWLRWVLLGVLVLFIAYVAWGLTLVAGRDRTDAAVAAIHSVHLTAADAAGSNLPTMPDKAQNDATVAGIDANHNDIRDDVELAIFAKYPHAPKARAAELQYALTEQMFLTRVVDTATWKAVAEEDERAHTCVLDSGANRKEVESWVFNTTLRQEAKNAAFNYTTSFGPAPGKPCDI